MAPTAPKLAPLLFGSGMCALIYQIAWFREFRMVFGASTAATAAVLAIFIGGLGAGGLVLGGRADRHPRPVSFYGQLEMLVAVFAALTPLFLWIARWAYVSLGGTSRLGLFAGSAVRLILSAIVLGVPTFLMGGTLPAAARGVEADDDLARRSTGLLYGVNTLGAVVGCSMSTFFMLERFGTRMTLWIACAVNLVVAIVAQRIGRDAPPITAPVAPASATDPIERSAAAPQWFSLSAAGIVGFAFFLMEMVWYRMLGPILGGTVFTFGLILAVALLGIGLGGAWYATFGKNRRATLSAFAATCLLEALFMAVPYALGDRVAIWTLLLRSFGVFGFSGLLLGWTIITLIVVLPAAFVAGLQFPLLIALLGGGRENVGKQIGLAYAFNTVGAIVGSLSGGFGLLPALTAPGCWRLVIWVLAALGFEAAVLGYNRSGRRALALAFPIASIVAISLLVRATGPTAVWRHSPIGVGRVEAESTSSESAMRGWMNDERRTVRWQADGVESSVALSNAQGWAFIVNGKIDGSARGDAATQVMGGLVGAILHPQPKSALVIGLGTGSTAGWLGSVPSIERVDVVEFEPVIKQVAAACLSVNRNVMQNPKVHITVGDAREVLLTSPSTYDIIFSEPSNPYRAGIASLFTREYYEAVVSRLNRGGLFLQWVQAYNVDAQAVRTIYATLQSAFPVIETWELAANDLLLVASRDPITYDADAIRARILEEPFKSALAGAWRAIDVEGFFAHYVARASMAEALAQAEHGRLNTDDRTLVEFGFARMAADNLAFSGKEIRKVARGRLEHRPSVVAGDIDWSRVDEQWASFLVAEEEPEDVLPDYLDKEQKARLYAQAQYLEGNSDKTVSYWLSQHHEPHTPTELAAVADAMASAGDDRARTHIEKLRVYQPTESEAIYARLLARQGKTQEAAARLEAAFERHRHDAWPWMVIGRSALTTVDDVTAADPSTAERLYRAISYPLPVYLHESRRLEVMLKIAMRTKLDVPCAKTLEAYEPHVPWQKEVLEWRSRCYAETGDPRASIAARELAEWSAEKPAPFEAGVVNAGSR
jgi:spermidine synthase